jgi:hypothetical protein
MIARLEALLVLFGRDRSYFSQAVWPITPVLSEGLLAAASEGLVVAAVPAVAYLVAYVYEVGFAMRFGIPLDFIRVSLTRVLAIASALLGYGVAMLAMSEYMAALYRWMEDRWSIIFLVAGFVTVFLMSYVVMDKRLSEALVSLMIVIIIYLSVLMFTSLPQNPQSGLLKKVIAPSIIKLPNGSRIPRLKLYILVALLILFPSASWLEGLDRAQGLTSFLVTPRSPEMVVLRTYGDEMICAPFDRDTREVYQSFVVLKVGDDPNLMLHYEEVGPLRPNGEPFGADTLPLQSPLPTPP